MTTPMFEAAETWTTVMITGHRRLPAGAEAWLRTALTERLTKLRDTYGTENAISGMALGSDMIFAEEALKLNLPLTAAVPFPSQPHDQYGPQWKPAQQQRWHNLCEQAVRVEYVSATDPLTLQLRNQMLHRRNDWMLQRAQAVLAIWARGNKRSGTYSCILKAVSADKPVIWFNLGAQTVTRPSRKRWAELLDKPGLAAAARR